MILPSPKDFNFLAHCYHANELVDYESFSDHREYPTHESERFTRIFKNQDVFQNKSVLDLGCHSGFATYCSVMAGAQNATGVNVRSRPLTVANHFVKSKNINNINFIQGDIENFDLIKNLTSQHDAVMMLSVLEHLRNPEHLIRTITDSQVDTLVIECSLSATNGVPMLEYRREETGDDFNSYDSDMKFALACMPNQKWFEMVLYFYNWKIVEFDIKRSDFNKDWFEFAGPSQSPITYPALRDSAVIIAKKR
jgi:SAM-dependent methyltransferase